ncbi:oxidoreductase C-terminal domain-containing protein [Streptomyces acidicola]|uniref:oxidoreductase C-terminal domain-containing protein n=1 Tax=Streptomyces acidicola TaxID=2596892 RepID=UPI00389A9CC6
MQMVGLSAGHDRCVTRGCTGPTLSAFYLTGDRVIAADVIGRPADFATAALPSRSRRSGTAFDFMTTVHLRTSFESRAGLEVNHQGDLASFIDSGK